MGHEDYHILVGGHTIEKIGNHCPRDKKLAVRLMSQPVTKKRIRFFFFKTESASFTYIEETGDICITSLIGLLCIN